MTLYDGDESGLVKVKSGSGFDEIIRLAHEMNAVRFKSNTCQAVGCEGLAEWIVEYGKYKVQLCEKHEKEEKRFKIEVDKK